ncbi:hematopoietic death receptor isoform X2 [Dunckerocampus dactyliophorus]|uniref:hematopoietic death receptor isoform X2 n=1 Tax=Dunckerocampus dactyliophorus TaxID=161453 RepID=UPI002405DEBC|nr:hematopoietic death receptor isoform X2 [Dunckerocampus dactyliophorus]
MSGILHVIVPYVLIGLFASVATFPRASSDLRDTRTRREVVCRDEEYLNNNICCLKCPAGTRVKSHCTTPREKGRCEECAAETYAEHANDFKQCIKCTTCHSDQEIVRPCSHTQDTECQCIEGRFCAPEQACEVCKKCSRCGKDEKVVRNCTATSNTECKKIQLQPDSASANALYIILGGGVTLVCLSLVLWAICCYTKKRRAADSLGNGVKVENVQERKNEQTQSVRCPNLILSQPLVRIQNPAAMEDEYQGLCESVSSSASNSQQNLTVLPKMREEEPFPKLIPVNGVESLRMCFQYFEEVDSDYHRKFFRQLGVNDNVIKSKDQLLYDDRIHELLNIWLEKEGKEASLNDLLDALLECNQKRTAELIKGKALEDGHYISEKLSQL